MRVGTVGKSFYLFMEGVLANIIHSVHSLEEPPSKFWYFRKQGFVSTFFGNNYRLSIKYIWKIISFIMKKHVAELFDQRE